MTVRITHTRTWERTDDVSDLGPMILVAGRARLPASGETRQVRPRREAWPFDAFNLLEALAIAITPTISPRQAYNTREAKPFHYPACFEAVTKYDLYIKYKITRWPPLGPTDQAHAHRFSRVVRPGRAAITARAVLSCATFPCLHLFLHPLTAPLSLWSRPHLASNARPGRGKHNAFVSL